MTRAVSRHPVAEAARETEPRRSRLQRCIALAEDSQATLRALRTLIAPDEDSDAPERHELAGV